MGGILATTRTFEFDLRFSDLRYLKSEKRSVLYSVPTLKNRTDKVGQFCSGYNFVM